jgi:hypothetical protein
MSAPQFLQVGSNADYVINTAHIMYLERKQIVLTDNNRELYSDSHIKSGTIYRIDIGLVKNTIKWDFGVEANRNAWFEKLRATLHPVTIPKPDGLLPEPLSQEVPDGGKSSAKRGRKPAEKRDGKT